MTVEGGALIALRAEVREADLGHPRKTIENRNLKIGVSWRQVVPCGRLEGCGGFGSRLADLKFGHYTSG
jgi:hypothetical protein